MGSCWYWSDLYPFRTLLIISHTASRRSTCVKFGRMPRLRRHTVCFPEQADAKKAYLEVTSGKPSLRTDTSALILSITTGSYWPPCVRSQWRKDQIYRNILFLTLRFIATGTPFSYSMPASPPSPARAAIRRRSSSSRSARLLSLDLMSGLVGDVDWVNVSSLAFEVLRAADCEETWACVMLASFVGGVCCCCWTFPG